MDTALSRQLNKEDLGSLGGRICQRIKDLEGAMDTFRKKRKKFRKWADGDYSDRKTQDEADIFSKENIPLEFVTGVAEFMAARTCDDLLGSDPYFAAIPQGDKGGSDTELASQIERHARHKLQKARYKAIAKEAIDSGYATGEGLVKCTWLKDVDKFEELAWVMVGPDGKPVVCEDGDYIHDDDPMVETPAGPVYAHQEVILFPPGAELQVIPESGDPLPILIDIDGKPIMNRDGQPWHEGDVRPVAPGVFVLSKGEVYPGGNFEQMALEGENVLYEGLDLRLVNFGDFIAPMDVPHLSKADFVGHRMSLKLSYLREHFQITKKTEKDIGVPDQKPKDDASKPIEHLGEKEAADTTTPDEKDKDPTYKCVEVYARMMVKGKMRRIYCCVEEDSETILAVDYWANVTPGGVLPFFAVVPKPVKDRWWGRGYHEIYESETDFVDRTFASVTYRNKQHSNPVKFIHLRAFKRNATAKSIIIEPGKVYELDENWVPEVPGQGPISIFEFPDLDSRTIWLFEMVIQMTQVRSGVTGAAQGAISNLPANGTATGVQSIMMSGSTLHKQPIEQCRDGLEDGLSLSLKVLYSNQNRDDTLTYLEGDATKVLTLNKESVQNLDLDVNIILTKMHEQETLESVKSAMQAINSYIQTPEMEKDPVRPLYVQLLKSLHIAGPDAIVRKAQPQESQPPPPHVQLPYKDTPPDVRRQIEAAAGFEPSQMPDVVPPAPGSPAPPGAVGPPGAQAAAPPPQGEVEPPLPEEALPENAV